jgi:hypothetical protein
MTIKIILFWGVTSVTQKKCTNVPVVPADSIFSVEDENLYSFTLKMKAAGSYEMLVPFLPSLYGVTPQGTVFTARYKM